MLDVIDCFLQSFLIMNSSFEIQIFHDEFLRKTYPELFWNLCWYCSRMGLPVPLAGPSFPQVQSTHDSASMASKRSSSASVSS